jgi:hypothetical protein
MLLLAAKRSRKIKKPIAFDLAMGSYKTVATFLLGQTLLSPEHTHAHAHGHGDWARRAIGVLGAEAHDDGDYGQTLIGVNSVSLQVAENRLRMALFDN